MKFIYRRLFPGLALVCLAAAAGFGQGFTQGFTLGKDGLVEVTNRSGRVEIVAAPATDIDTAAAENVKVSVTSDRGVTESEVSVVAAGSSIVISTKPADPKKRIDLHIQVPERTRLRIETADGEARISGDFASIEAASETGTISADVPTDDLRYDFQWTESRPRFLSDIVLDKVKEKSGGRFSIKGRYPDGKSRSPEKGDEPSTEIVSDAPPDTENPEKSKKSPKAAKPAENTVSLKFSTARGIVLLNVPPGEVSSDLRERPLTNAAKAIVRSGDSLLTEAIRRASPKYFGDYLKTLPPIKREPTFGEREKRAGVPTATVKRALVSVTDLNNRSIANLRSDEFEVLENNEPRGVKSIKPTTAPFNLVLLLDVSGSVDNYVDFIRKAARSFVETVGPEDKIAIVTFNEDIHPLSNFSGNKVKLSASLDTFDAGGGTAYYDALAYTLAETLRPLKGERTAVVVLTDGDDNRSFLSFNSLLGSIQESGALIYPLYVPSALVAAGAAGDPGRSADPLRAKYMGLTTKAEGEGARLAEVSGGQYYPITQISQIQAAYDDIVRQLRTAYSITYESNTVEMASPRLKIRVKRDNAFVKIASVVEVGKDE